jgi:hypothetical protein
MMVSETCSPDRVNDRDEEVLEAQQQRIDKNLDAFVGSWDELQFEWQPHIFIEENRLGLRHLVTNLVFILKMHGTRNKKKLHKDLQGFVIHPAQVGLAEAQQIKTAWKPNSSSTHPTQRETQST